MSVYKSKGSKSFRYDFWCGGYRFVGNCGESKTKREAKSVERKARIEAREEIARLNALKGGPLTLDYAAGRYFAERGQHHAVPATALTNLNRILKFLGKDKLLSDITDNDVAKLIAWRRGHRVKDRKTAPLVSPSTVNRSTLIPLKDLFHRAKKAWGMNFPAEPGWEVHRLDEPKERVRILRDDEAERLEQTARSDYGPFWQFLDESGFRLSEGLLRWSQVDWSGRQINTIGKSAKSISRPISDAMHEILWPLQGHHKEWVFTYIAKRTKGTRIKGQRYPLTVSGIKTEHRRMKDRAEVTNFRIHDRRHTFATELLRESNLRVVQKALNHSSTKTTEKYAHALNEDVREAMNRASRSRKKSHKSEREAG